MSYRMSPEAGDPRRGLRSRRRGRALLPTVLVVAALLALFGLFTNLYTDWLWFRSLGSEGVFTRVFRTELIVKTLLFLVFGALLGGGVAANFVIAYRNRPVYPAMSPEQANLDRYRTSVEPFRRLLVVAAGAALALIGGSSAASNWQTFLLWRNGQPFDVRDPQFGMDVSFYAFSLPWWRFLLSFLFTALVLSLLAAAVTHYLYGGLRLQGAGERTTPAARVHLSVLLGVFVLAKAVAYWLDRYSLAVKSAKVGGSDITGLTYTDINAVLPGKTILAVISVIVAALFIANVVRRTWLLPAVGVGLLALSAVLVGTVYPAIVQYFQVKPTEATREDLSLRRHIEATRDAYDIADTETRTYDAKSDASPAEVQAASGSIPSIRLLDPAVVSPTFKQNQQITQYYDFADTLDVDRYTIDGRPTDTVVAVRELNLDGINVAQRNWINDHTFYTHGYGLVAAPGNTRSADGTPDYVEGTLPPTGDLGKFEPRVYFGEKSPVYSIVGAPKGAPPGELDYAGPTGEQRNTYTGDGGVPVGSLFHQMLFAVKFQEEKILLSGQVNDQSKILYTRNPRERVTKVAPWLTVDGDPYPSIVDGRLVWIVDGYTTSNGYPYSKRTSLDRATQDTTTVRSSTVAAQAAEQVNYMRNSVKATVDAYDGAVKLYEWDQEDPVLATWMQAFPGTVTPRDQISPGLLAHLRYPEDMFKVQRTLLAQYHVKTASEFFSGDSFWRVPRDPTITQTPSDQPPYYLTLRMPGQERAKFSLTTTYVPRGENRENLTAFAAVVADAGNDPKDPYGKIRVLQVPTGVTVKGPVQAQNDFGSNPAARNQLALLSRNNGSDTVYGNLLTLPFAGGLLYVEPVYVKASGASGFPLLQKVLVSFGNRIALEDTLDRALQKVFQTTGAPPQGEQPVTPPPANGDSGGGDPRVGAALAEAQRALNDANRALAAGDFAAYGEAQKRLRDAIARAVAAQRATPSPSPSPSPGSTASPSPVSTVAPLPASPGPTPTTSVEAAGP